MPPGEVFDLWELYLIAHGKGNNGEGTGHCSVTFLCEPFAESIGYNQKAVQSVSLPDTVTINVKGTQETDGLIYITARGTITNLTVTRLKVN